VIHYILKDRKPVEVSLWEWSKWYEDFKNRRVAQDSVMSDHGEIWVSTVFLGIDHNYHTVGLPVLFETLISGGRHDQHISRYRTWDESESGHKVCVRLARMGVFLDKQELEVEIKDMTK